MVNDRSSTSRELRQRVAFAIDTLELRRLLSAGGLDASLHGGGTDTPVVINVAGGATTTDDVAVSSDGKIIVTGFFTPAGNTDDATQFFLARFDAGGTLDARFGNGGTILGTPRGSVVGHRVALGSDGSIYVLTNSAPQDIRRDEGNRVLHFGGTGKLDRTFGKNGSIKSDFAADFAIDGNGRVLIADGAGAVHRFSAAGEIDRTFATGGTFSDAEAGDNFDRVYVDSQDRIWIAGDNTSTSTISDQQSGSGFALRLLEDGTLDATFGNGGRFDLAEQHDLSTSTDLAISPDGSGATLRDGRSEIYNSFTPGDERTPTELEPIIGGSMGGSSIIAGAGAIRDANGGLIVSALREPDGGDVADRIVARVISNPDRSAGQPALIRDPNFGTAGVTLLAANDQSDQTTSRYRDDAAIDLAPDGTIVAAVNLGFVPNDGAADTRHFALARLFNGDAPVATLTRAADITPGRSGSQPLTVTYRGATPIDTSTFDRSDLRITAPNGTITTARFIGFASSDGGTVVEAHYKLAAPGGTWDASDDGTYSVRLVGRSVNDIGGHFATGRTLGAFDVDV